MTMERTYTITLSKKRKVMDDIAAAGDATGLWLEEFPEAKVAITSIKWKAGDKPNTWVVTLTGEER